MVSLTEKAVTELKRLIAEQQESDADGDKIYLRVRVVGGGCSGFQHKLDLDTNTTEKDEFYECQGVPIVVDNRSVLYAAGVVIDFLDDLNQRGFLVKNPNTKTCGCGSACG